MNIRKAQISDLKTINQIYNQSVERGGLTADIDLVTDEQRMKWFNIHDQDHYPVFVYEHDHLICGWISLSPYRPGRRALIHTAEISYYVDNEHQGKGIGSELMNYAIVNAAGYKLKTLFAVLLETNTISIKLLEKFNFEKWAYLPDVADIDGKEVGQFYYGRKV
jgi:L-amino acid N-acyltransferase YncA